MERWSSTRVTVWKVKPSRITETGNVVCTLSASKREESVFGREIDRCTCPNKFHRREQKREEHGESHLWTKEKITISQFDPYVCACVRLPIDWKVQWHSLLSLLTSSGTGPRMMISFFLDAERDCPTMRMRGKRIDAGSFPAWIRI